MYGLELLNQSNLILSIRFLQIVYQEKHEANYYENIAMCTWQKVGAGGGGGGRRTFLSYDQIFSWRVQPRTVTYI